MLITIKGDLIMYVKEVLDDLGINEEDSRKILESTPKDNFEIFFSFKIAFCISPNFS